MGGFATRYGRDRDPAGSARSVRVTRMMSRGRWVFVGVAGAPIPCWYVSSMARVLVGTCEYSSATLATTRRGVLSEAVLARGGLVSQNPLQRRYRSSS
jgi:hypothetical protein